MITLLVLLFGFSDFHFDLCLVLVCCLTADLCVGCLRLLRIALIDLLRFDALWFDGLGIVRGVGVW